jgi:pseudouridine synthase
MPAERLQKLLAAAGYGSRRACEDYLTAGRVRVNGSVAQLGDKADPATDKITVDGELLTVEQHVYIILNKPRGVVSSLEAQGDRDTVRDLVKIPQRVYPVGRLDVLSEGLVLLTNDGDLTNQLTHPRYGHEKEYRVAVLGNVGQSLLESWRRGIVIKDEEGHSEHTAPANVEIDSRVGELTWVRVIMREGKKHQIRRVAETLGLTVTRLIRVRMGLVQLGSLQAGAWRSLTPAEVKALKTQSHSAPKSQRSKTHKPKSPSRPADTSRKPKPKRDFKDQSKFKTRSNSKPRR